MWGDVNWHCFVYNYLWRCWRQCFGYNYLWCCWHCFGYKYFWWCCWHCFGYIIIMTIVGYNYLWYLQALESCDLKKLITNVGSGVGAAPAAGGKAFPCSSIAMRDILVRIRTRGFEHVTQLIRIRTYLWLTDPDPGGPKTYGSSVSTTLPWLSVGQRLAMIRFLIDSHVSYPPFYLGADRRCRFCRQFISFILSRLVFTFYLLGTGVNWK